MAKVKVSPFMFPSFIAKVLERDNGRVRVRHPQDKRVKLWFDKDEYKEVK